MRNLQGEKSLRVSDNESGESTKGAVLIHFFVPDAALIRGQHLIEGSAYSSKYGIVNYFLVMINQDTEK